MGRILGLFMLLTATVAAAQEKPTIRDLTVSLDGRRVLASFHLENGFGTELRERIESGLPSGFVFRFKLYRDHKKWFDRQLESAALEVVGIYNAVTREYLVNYKQDGRLIESRIVRDLRELEAAMTEFENLSIFTLGEIPADWRLLIRVRADLGMGSFLFFPTTISTEQVESRKFDPPSTER